VGVEVAWAETSCTSFASSPLEDNASLIALICPSPEPSGRTRWYPSVVQPWPKTSAMMGAPLLWACYRLSTTTTPAPSPRTKPERCRSKGLEA
jgi:hypothetical protein